jgi:hypothetical protein
MPALFYESKSSDRKKNLYIMRPMCPFLRTSEERKSFFKTSLCMMPKLKEGSTWNMLEKCVQRHARTHFLTYA